MPSLISRVFGISEASSARRPQMLEFQGINYNSNQAANLVAFFPLWEGPGAPCFDYGPQQLQGAPTNILRTQDPYFGDVYQGDGVTRGYKVPYNAALNFGIGPTPFSICFWFNVVAGFNPGLDVYLLTFDDPGQTNFPGYAVSFDTGSKWACNTGNTSGSDAGHKTTDGLNDGRWHHLCFSHYPQGTAVGGGALNTYFIDGKVNAAYFADFNVGAVGTTVPLYIGTDDNGTSQPLDQIQVCDLRLYNSALGASATAQIYHPDTRWELYQPARKSFYPLGVPPAVTNYTASFSGSATPSGSLARLAAKPLAGSTTPAGSLARQAAKALAGSASAAGTLSRLAAKPLAGSASASGGLARSVLKPLAGSASAAGSLARSVGKALAGSASAAGSLARSLARPLSGSASPSGSLTRSVLRTLAGSASAAGSLARQAGKAVAGSASPVGSLTRASSRLLSGSASAAGSLAKRAAKSLAGSASPSGVLSAVRVVLVSLAGSASPIGTLSRRTGKALSGSASASGTLARSLGRTLSGSASAVGSLVRRAAKPLAGSTSPTGSLSAIRAVLISLFGSATPSGSLTRSALKSLAGSASPSGSLSRRVAKSLAGSASAAGSLARRVAKSLAGAASAAGSLSATLVGGGAASAAFYFRRYVLDRRRSR